MFSPCLSPLIVFTEFWCYRWRLLTSSATTRKLAGRINIASWHRTPRTTTDFALTLAHRWNLPFSLSLFAFCFLAELTTKADYTTRQIQLTQIGTHSESDSIICQHAIKNSARFSFMAKIWHWSVIGRHTMVQPYAEHQMRWNDAYINCLIFDCQTTTTVYIEALKKSTYLCLRHNPICVTAWKVT